MSHLAKKSPRFFTAIAAALMGLMPLALHAIAPAAPSNVTAGTSRYVNFSPQASAILVRWEDNSFDEDFFRIQARVGASGAWTTVALAGSSFEFSEFFINSAITGNLFFRVQAVKNTTPEESSVSGAVLTTINSTESSFAAPTSLSASNVSGDDGTIQFSWSENSKTEERYLLEYKLTSAADTAYAAFNTYEEPWTSSPWVVGTVPFDFNNIKSRHGLKPGAEYTFRIRAGRRSPLYQSGDLQGQPTYTNFTEYTTYTTSTSVTIPALAAPTNFTVTEVDESTVRLKWTDNSNNEGDFNYDSNATQRGGFGVMWTITGFSDFQQYILSPIEKNTQTGARTGNVTVSAVPGLSTGWSLKAVHRDGPEASPALSESARTSTVTLKTNFKAPTNLIFIKNTDTNVDVIWKDNSAVESVYVVESRQGSNAFAELTRVASNTTRANITLPTGGVSEVRVRALNNAFGIDSYSDPSNVVSITVPNGIVGRAWHPAVKGVAFTSPTAHLLSTAASPARTSLTQTGLPVTVTLNASTGAFSGNFTESGIYESLVTATFSDGSSDTHKVTFRVAEPEAAPSNAGAPTTLTIPTAGTISIPLHEIFKDPDSPSAVAVNTSAGNFKIILQNDLTPQTVANFMAYVNGGDYAGVAIHRAVPGFVVQMGGYKPTAAASPDNNFTPVTARPSPLNEPGISNIRRTVAMAKQGGLPNSATHDFFVSLADNSSNLDEQNEGFTVFGRVPANLMTVPDLLAGNSIVQETVKIKLPNGSTTFSQSFDYWPLTSANGLTAESDGVKPVDKNKIYTVSSVTSIPTMNFSNVGSDNSAVVTVNLSSGSGLDTSMLELTPASEGTANVSVTATDLDGINPVTHTIAVTVSSSATATVITSQPTGGSVSSGNNFTFSVGAAGDSLGYQWRKGGKPISGQTSSSLSLVNVQTSDAGSYDVVVSGTGGLVVSTAVTLSVTAAPTFTKQPASITRSFRGTATFAVEASGSGTVTYQWKKNGRVLSGATSATLTLSPVLISSAGNYTCTATNTLGSTESNIATLTVTPTDQDNDGLADDQEIIRGTDLFDKDSDDDGYSDGLEVAGSSDPKSATSTPATVIVAASAERERLLGNIAMQKVPSGTITDGLDSTNKTVSAMWMSTYELTNAEWAAVLQHAKDVMSILELVDESGTTKAKVRGNVVCNVPTHKQGDTGSLGVDEVKLSEDGSTFVVSKAVADYPVRGVSWWGAYLAAEVLNSFHSYGSKTVIGTNGFNFAASGFYIPRDHEWEWVARGATAPTPANLYPVGAAMLPAKANYDASAILKTKPVKSYTPSKLGCYQLAGNVAEWIFEENSTTSGNGYTRGAGYDDAVSETANNVRRTLPRNTIDPAVGIRLALLDPNDTITINETGLPDHKVVATGTTLTLNAPSTGTPPRVYTWYKNGAVVKGQTSPTLSIPSAKLTDAGKYNVKVTNGNKPAGVISKFVNVAMVERVDKVITKPYNGTVTLTAKAVGPGLTYQWKKNEENLSQSAQYQGVTSPSLKIIDINANATANYTCLVTGPGSNNSQLTGITSVLFLDKPILTGTISGSFTDDTVPQIVGRSIAFAPNYNTSVVVTPTSFKITGLPKGLFYNPSTGIIFGRPLVSGEFTITVIASNAKGASNKVVIGLIVEPFPAGAVGDFVGSIDPEPDVNTDLGGWFKLTTTTVGSYTGTLTVDGVTHNITGTLEPETASSTSLINGGVDIPRTGKTTLRFAFQINPATNRVVAGLSAYLPPASAPDFFVDGAGWRNMWTAGSAFSYEGKQNVHLSIPSGDINNKTVPQGETYVTISTTNKGITNVNGRAADGTSINYSGLLGPTGEVLLYHAPYGTKGTMIGTLTVDSTSEQRVTGTARWKKLSLGSGSTDRNYKDGFGAITLTAEGGKYRIPTGGNLVVSLPTATAPAVNGKITFSSLKENTGGTALEGSVFSVFNISSSHAVTHNGQINLQDMTIFPTTGLFTGKVRIIDGSDTREVTYYGLFVPNATPGQSGRGYGSMLLPNLPNPLTAPYISSKVAIEKQP